MAPFLLLIAALLCSPSDAATSSLGINYGRLAPDLPSPASSVSLIKRLGFGRVKLFDSDPLVLSALARSGLRVVVGVPNADIPSLSRHPAAADLWVRRSILPHWPSTRIVLVNVGNEILSNRSDLASLRPRLLPTMKNIYTSLSRYNLSKAIKVTTSVAMDTLAVYYPPSAGRFSEDMASLFMKPILHFLSRTNSVFFLNVYPYLSWATDPEHISLAYASLEIVENENEKCRYNNMISAQIDAVIAAMEKLGYPRLRVVISETGWPSMGDSDQPGANLQYAAAYNQRLARRVLAKVPRGTPKRPGKRIPAYIFSLFDESDKPGPSTERNWGILYSNGTPKYVLNLRGEIREEEQFRKPDGPLPVLPTPASNTNHASQPVPQRRQSSSFPSSNNSFPPVHSSHIIPSFPAKLPAAWCVVNSSMDQTFVQEAMLVACSFGGADCTPIEPGKSCFQPNTLQAHASYVFNSYWQKTKHLGGTCTFDGAAILTHMNPSYEGCTFEYRD